VARELTKLFEETSRGTLETLAAHYSQKGAPRGEIVVVVAPPQAKAEASDDALDAFLASVLERGVKEAATLAADALGVSRKRAYARALSLKERA
jgi:16S rRNA (cytidine1402-2'-O)-methyltransferase